MKHVAQFVFALILFIIIAAAGYAFSLLSQEGEVPAPSQEEERAQHVEAVVSSHEIATNAGLEILEKGGTAADAAVAVASTLTVVEPWFSSALGGGTWALYYEAETGEVTSLDGVGPVGSLASVEDYARRAEEPGMHQAIVPGAWDGWMLWLERYGTLDLDQVLAPAIRAGREGYPVGSQMAFWLNRLSEEILAREDAAAIYAPEGELLEEGDMVYQREIADTFARLASAYEEGMAEGRSEAVQAARDYYYRGPIARKIGEFSDRHEGYLTLRDLNAFEAEIVEPLSLAYDNEVTVYQNPPNSQGITMLLALNILKEYDLSGLSPDDADAVHLQAEAVKLAFADRYHHVGDPERVPVPVEALLSQGHARTQASRIDMDRAAKWPIADMLEVPQDSHTTTFHIIDRFGNAAAVTTSLGAEFLVVGDTGIHINNRMRMVSLEEGNPNRLTPGYKVRHTSNPYMVLREGKPFILGGNTGVDTQPQGQMQQFLHVVEFGLSAQEAIDRPRFVSTAFPAGTPPYRAENTLQMEQGFSSELVRELRRRGHNVRVGEGIVGSAHMLVVIGEGEDVEIGAESRSTLADGKKKLPAKMEE